MAPTKEREQTALEGEALQPLACCNKPGLVRCDEPQLRVTIMLPGRELRAIGPVDDENGLVRVSEKEARRLREDAEG